MMLSVQSQLDWCDLLFRSAQWGGASETMQEQVVVIEGAFPFAYPQTHYTKDTLHETPCPPLYGSTLESNGLNLAD